MFERHRVRLDVFVNDELHARKADTIYRQGGQTKSLVGITQVHHDLGLGMLQVSEVGLLDLKVQNPLVDISSLTLGTAHGGLLTVFEYLGPIVCSNDCGNAELT
ncbi:hypothetical protein BMS3Abin16_00124 [archaeon BMS3Abin16]|nr:hypothetical protein BMS3Abin16_00124 [archaeon BMS3Abin16]